MPPKSLAAGERPGGGSQEWIGRACKEDATPTEAEILESSNLKALLVVVTVPPCLFLPQHQLTGS